MIQPAITSFLSTRGLHQPGICLFAVLLSPTADSHLMRIMDIIPIAFEFFITHQARVAAARPKALPMADGQTIGKLPLAAATQTYEILNRNRDHLRFASRADSGVR
jgi:hypothetical protein